MRFAAVLLLALAACTNGTSTPTASPTQPLTPTNGEADAKIAALDKQVKDLKEAVSANYLEFAKFRSRHDSAEFDPTESKFQRIDSDISSFAVSVQDVSSFGDGVRVKIDLGNLSSATVSGVTLHLTYGARQPTDDADAWAKWYTALKKKDADITVPLAPGSWNPVTVVLPGIEPRGFGYVSISIENKTIALRTR